MQLESQNNAGTDQLDSTSDGSVEQSSGALLEQLQNDGVMESEQDLQGDEGLPDGFPSADDLLDFGVDGDGGEESGTNGEAMNERAGTDSLRDGAGGGGSFEQEDGQSNLEADSDGSEEDSDFMRDGSGGGGAYGKGEGPSGLDSDSDGSEGSESMQDDGDPGSQREEDGQLEPDSDDRSEESAEEFLYRAGEAASVREREV